MRRPLNAHLGPLQFNGAVVSKFEPSLSECFYSGEQVLVVFAGSR
jgi:hypothetical protein